MIIMQNSSYVNANSTKEDNELTTDWSEGNVLRGKHVWALNPLLTIVIFELALNSTKKGTKRNILYEDSGQEVMAL
jgi:hypothetical protein